MNERRLENEISQTDTQLQYNNKIRLNDEK